ncbi:MAG: amidohydrolase [Anaerolineales bacterium]
MKPTRLLYNGEIHTFDDAYSIQNAVAIENSRILAVGDYSQIKDLKSPSTELIDLKGSCVLPGFTDAHIHLQQYALTLEYVDCETETREACLEGVREQAAATPRGVWIRGHGWNQNIWDRYGTRADLDAVAPENPVYLTAKSLHAAWVNSYALSEASLDDNSIDPPRGELARNADGSLSGILFEDAMQLVSQKIPPASQEQVVKAIKRAQEELLMLGITSVHDFDGPTCFAALNHLRQAGELRLRVVKNLQRESLEAMLDLGLASGVGDLQLRIGNLKLFADGALGPQTAAMLEPYEGSDSEVGMLTEDEEALTAIGRAATNAGIGLAIHAIGDRANREVLNAFEKLIAERSARGLPALQHRMEHLQLLHPDDIDRPGKLGIAASMQPIHAISDMDMAETKWGVRARTSYAWKSQLMAGAKLVFGSDAPVENPNPFPGIHAAISRRKPDGAPGPEGWIPEERLSLREALTAYIRTPPEIVGWGSALGQILPGYLADFVILSERPLDIVDEWLMTKPIGVMANGIWVVSFEQSS